MKCNKCSWVFNPHENAKIGHFQGDCVEVRTACQHCGHEYYTFTGHVWAQEEQAQALITNVLTKQAQALTTNVLTVHALSIRQPWAWLILHGGKDIENREWTRGFTGRCLIHASATMTKCDYEACLIFLAGLAKSPTPIPDYDVLRKECGGIVGSVHIDGCVTKSRSSWFTGPYGFQLSNPKALSVMIPCKGSTFFFKVPEYLLNQIVEAA